MKKLFLAVALATASVPLITACATVQAPSEQVVLRGTQALIAAEYAYNGVGQIILPLLRNGTIKGADATRVREINAKATQLLIAGKAAKDGFAQADIARQLLELVSQLNTIKGGK